MKIEITDHAYDRMTERCGFNKKAGKRLATLAYDKGLKHSETSGKVYGYIGAKAKKHMKPGTSFRLYGEVVYCFVETVDSFTIEPKAVLITVWAIPQYLKKHAIGLQQKKKDKSKKVVE